MASRKEKSFEVKKNNVLAGKIYPRLQPNPSYHHSFNHYLERTINIPGKLQEMVDSPKGCLDILRCLYIVHTYQENLTGARNLMKHYKELNKVNLKKLDRKKQPMDHKQIEHLIGYMEDFVKSSSGFIADDDLYEVVDKRFHDHIESLKRSKIDLSLIEKKYGHHCDNISGDGQVVRQMERYLDRLRTRFGGVSRDNKGFVGIESRIFPIPTLDLSQISTFSQEYDRF